MARKTIAGLEKQLEATRNVYTLSIESRERLFAEHENLKKVYSDLSIRHFDLKRDHAWLQDYSKSVLETFRAITRQPSK